MQGVPAHYVKTAPVEWAQEFFSSAGCDMHLGHAVLPAPSFGVWAMLELLECDFVHPREDSTIGGAIIASYVAAHGRHCLPLVMDHLQSGRTDSSFDLDSLDDETSLIQLAVTWAGVNNITDAEEIVRLCRWFTVSFSGFNMIPAGGGGGEQIFGMDSFGAIVAAIGGDLGLGYDALLWDVPMTVIGHVVAQKSKQNGAKGIARPKDTVHMREQLDETARREEAGLLYEWQEKEPWSYDLDGHETEDEAYRYAVLQHEARKSNKGAE
jgi:hypothetical protein